MSGILRLSHVEVRVPDLELATAYYVEVVGLIEVERSDDEHGRRVYLKGWDEHQHHSIVLAKAPTYGLDALGFKVEAESDLDALEARIEAAGVAVTRHPPGELGPGSGTTLRFRAPSGHVVELVHGMAQVGNGMPRLNPPVGPDGLVGMHPPRIDHIFLMCEDVNGATDFFRDVLDFRMTEQILADDGYQLATFLERSHSTHDIAFLTGPDGGFHHVAFWVDDWNDLRHGADTCAYHGITVDAETDVLVSPALSEPDVDTPGRFGAMARALADAGINISLVYVASRNRVVLATSDDPPSGGLERTVDVNGRPWVIEVQDAREVDRSLQLAVGAFAILLLAGLVLFFRRARDHDEATRRSARVIGRTADVAQALAAAATVDEVDGVIREQLARVLDAKAASIGFVDHDRGVLHLGPSVGAHPGIVIPSADVPLDQRRPVTEAVRTGEPVLVRSIADWHEHAPDDLVAEAERAGEDVFQCHGGLLAWRAWWIRRRRLLLVRTKKRSTTRTWRGRPAAAPWPGNRRSAAGSASWRRPSRCSRATPSICAAT